MQTFSLVNILDVQRQREAIVIKILAMNKTSGPLQAQPTITLPFFKKNKKIHVATTILNNLEKTKEIRGSTNEMIVSYQRSHNKVTAQTISR